MMDVDLEAIKQAIGHGLSCGRTRIEDIAQLLLISKSTLQRRMPEGTTFTGLRREVQVRMALRLLGEGRSVMGAADDVCLSPDHLRVMIREATNLSPGQISRAAQLSGKLLRWKRGYPPQYGTSLYRHRVREWRKIDAEMLDLIGEITPENPLFAWANKLLELSAKPDFRRQPYRDRLRARRRRESEQFQEMLQRVLGDIKERQ